MKNQLSHRNLAGDSVMQWERTTWLGFSYVNDMIREQSMPALVLGVGRPAGLPEQDLKDPLCENINIGIYA